MNSIALLLITLLFSTGCTKKNDETSPLNPEVDITAKASIVSVSVSGNENKYTFSVGVSSPETGCDQYADWWEVITTEGELIYRRILAHSHVDEQPFVRSGGPVTITSHQQVYIRAHMNSSGYGTIVFLGAVADGFQKTTLDDQFAKALDQQQPLPNGCAF